MFCFSADRVWQIARFCHITIAVPFGNKKNRVKYCYCSQPFGCPDSGKNVCLFSNELYVQISGDLQSDERVYRRVINSNYQLVILMPENLFYNPLGSSLAPGIMSHSSHEAVVCRFLCLTDREFAPTCRYI